MAKIYKFKNIGFTEGEYEAIVQLHKDGYDWDKTKVVKKMLREIWAIKYPGRPFPGDEEKGKA